MIDRPAGQRITSAAMKLPAMAPMTPSAAAQAIACPSMAIAAVYSGLPQASSLHPPPLRRPAHPFGAGARWRVPMKALELLAGLLLVSAVLADVFSSVLVPRPSPRRLRAAPLLSWLMSPIWHRVAVRMPSARLRQSVRASLGPAILVLSLGFWVATLTLGFALLLYALPQTVHLQHRGFGDTLFQAALAISTLGMLNADITGWGRVVVACAGISGFSILTLVIAFLLSIQGALHSREQRVLTLDARAGRPPSACTLVMSLAGAGDDALARLFEQWEAWTGELQQSHLAYPVLLRFRSLHEDGEWLACLGAILDFAALIRAADPDGYREACRAAGFLAVTAARTTHEFARVLGLPRAQTPLDRIDGDQLVRHLTRHGFAPRASAAFEERLRTLRADHAARLPQLAARLDQHWHDTLLGTRPL